MPRIRAINETDETIIIEPGDALDLLGEETDDKVQSNRLRRFHVEETKDASGGNATTTTGGP